MFAAAPRTPRRERRRPRHAPRVRERASGSVIPYDMAATFRITGRPGNLLQDVINVSTDGVFVAVGIGYGFEEDRERPLAAPDALSALADVPPIVVGDLSLSQLPLAALIEGFRVNPKFASLGLRRLDDPQRTRFLGQRRRHPIPCPPIGSSASVLQRIKPPEESVVPVQPRGQRHRTRIPGPGRA